MRDGWARKVGVVSIAMMSRRSNGVGTSEWEVYNGFVINQVRIFTVTMYTLFVLTLMYCNVRRLTCLQLGGYMKSVRIFPCIFKPLKFRLILGQQPQSD